MKQIFLARYHLKAIFSSYQRRILVSFLVCSVLPLAIVSIFLFTFTYNIAKEKTLDSAKILHNQLATSISMRFSQVQNVSDSVLYNVYCMVNEPTTSIRNYMERYSDVSSTLSSFKNAFDFHSIIVYVDEELPISNHNLMFCSIKDLLESSWCPEDVISTGTNVKWQFSSEQKFPYVLNLSDDPCDVISCYRTFFNVKTGKLEYAYFINLRSEEFSKMIQNAYDTSEFVGYIVTQDGYITAHSNPESQGDVVDHKQMSTVINASEEEFQENSNTYLITHQLPYTDWFFVTEIPKSYILENSYSLISILIIVLIVILTFDFLGSLFLSKSITKRIHLLSIVISKTKPGRNNTDLQALDCMVQKPVELQDEVDRLAVHFKKLAETIDTSMEQILTISLREETLKFQLLQAKINPHFLYNILETIKAYQVIGKLDVSGQMISDLAQFYRMILKKSDDLITIGEEWQLSMLYLNLEARCKQDLFCWKVEMDSEIENFLICKFTLQPILENCILHGMRRTDPKLFISVKVCYSDEEIVITISDNGNGIPQMRLHRLQESLRMGTVSTTEFFGICNVNARLSMYSEKNQILINSVEGKGTTVTIIIEQML